MSPDARPPVLRLADGVIFRPIDAREGALLDLERRRFYSLNPAALYLLEELQQGRTRAELVAGLTERFALAAEAAAADVDGFVAELREAGLLVESAG